MRATSNVKHTIILFGFSGHGIRLIELLALKLDDMLWDRDQLVIDKGKGKKDRYVPPSQECKEMLTMHIHEYKPIYYLFEGQDKKSQSTERSTQQVVSKAAQKAGLRIRVTPLMLRHSFATHLMDGGTQLPFIKELLGHSHIKTTMIYTHITTTSLDKIVSPWDELRGRK